MTGMWESLPPAWRIHAIINTWFRPGLGHLFLITWLCPAKHYGWPRAASIHAIINTCLNVRKIADSRARPVCIKNSLVHSAAVSAPMGVNQFLPFLVTVLLSGLQTAVPPLGTLY